MPVVVVEYQRSHPQSRGGVGRSHERGDRAELVREVVGEVQGGVAERLDLPSLLLPGAGVGRAVLLHSEPEGARLVHGA